MNKAEKFGLGYLIMIVLFVIFMCLCVSCSFKDTPVINYGHSRHQLRPYDSLETKQVKTIIFKCEKINGWGQKCTFTDTFHIYKSSFR